MKNLIIVLIVSIICTIIYSCYLYYGEDYNLYSNNFLFSVLFFGVGEFFILLSAIKGFKWFKRKK